MDTTPAMRMADKLAKGRLEERLTELDDAGDSWDTISRKLYAEFGIEATGQTIGGWLLRIERRREAEEAAS